MHKHKKLTIVLLFILVSGTALLYAATAATPSISGTDFFNVKIDGPVAKCLDGKIIFGGACDEVDYTDLTGEQKEFLHAQADDLTEAQIAALIEEFGDNETPVVTSNSANSSPIVCNTRFLHAQPKASPDVVLKSIRDIPVEPKTNDGISSVYTKVYRNEYSADTKFPIGGDKFPVFVGKPGVKELFYINGSQNSMYLFPNPEDDIYLAPKAFHADVYGDFNQLFVDPYHNFNRANHTPGSATRLTDLDINLQETNSKQKPHRVITIAETNRNLNTISLAKGYLTLDERARIGGNWVSNQPTFSFDEVIWGVPAGVNTWWNDSIESKYGVSCN